MLAHIIRRCQDLPGQRLFEFVDEQAQVQPVSSEDVNTYICDITGADFTSKDFRTWKGSVSGLSILSAMGPPASPTEARKNIVQAMKQVAAELGNRPATARKYYVHPVILEAYADGRLDRAAPPENGRKERPQAISRSMKSISWPCCVATTCTRSSPGIPRSYWSRWS